VSSFQKEKNSMETSPNKRLMIKIDPNTLIEEWDSTFQLISWWNKEEVKNAKVLVVGSGALGNEVLKNLALLGVGHIVLVDFDHIEFSNLSRSVLFRKKDIEDKRAKVDVAAERVKEINPEIKIKPIHGDIILDIGLGVFRRMDAIIGCLDNLLARLYLNRYSFWMGKTWIDGAIENLAGQLNVFTPGKSCFESGLSPQEHENISIRMGCADVNRRNETMGRIPTTPISSSIIAALQTQEALKVIHRNESKLMSGKTFYFEGMNNEFWSFNGPEPHTDSLSSHFYENIIDAENLSHESTVKEVLDWAKDYFNDPHPVIRLHHRIVTELKQEHKTVKVRKAFLHLSDDFITQHFEDPTKVITNSVGNLDYNFEFQDSPLNEFGIPPLHILKIYANGQENYVELTGDISFLNF
jgi:molybdopterin/thiamine biosynthesis adenylyltransferase